jgi:type VI secretion system secreted protein VgrG
VTDHLGTPQELYDDEVGEIAWAADFSAYGETVRQIAREVDNPIRFPGQYYDPESGLHYNRFRYYDPQAGRYINQDPIGLEGGANLYSYALGNPARFTDPSGKFVWLIPIVTGAIGGVAGAVGSYVNQKYIQRNCKVDLMQVGNAFAWGGAAGAALPFAAGAGTLGAIGVGAAAGEGQYLTGQVISGETITGSGALISAGTGALGGAVAGAFTRTIGYGAVGTALPELATQRQAMQSAVANAGAIPLVRNVGGGTIGNYDVSALTNQSCGCK